MHPVDIKCALATASPRPYTQSAVGLSCGVVKSMVHDVIHGNRRNRKVESRIAKITGIALAELWPQWYGAPVQPPAKLLHRGEVVYVNGEIRYPHNPAHSPMHGPLPFNLDRVTNGHLRDIAAIVDALEHGDSLVTYAQREIAVLAVDLSHEDWLRLLTMARTLALISAQTQKEGVCA